MKHKKTVITVIVCLAAAVALVAALRISAAQNQPVEEDGPSLVPVQTVAPQIKDLSNKMDFIGSISAGESVAVMPKLTAKVTDINIKSGDEVQAGDVLYVLDTSDLNSQVELTKLALTSAQLSYELTTGVTLPTQEDSAYLQYDAIRDAYKDAEDAYDDLVKNKNEKITAMQAEIGRTKNDLEGYVEANWPGKTVSEAITLATLDYKTAAAAYESAYAANPEDPALIDLKAAMDGASNALSTLQTLNSAYELAKGNLDTYQSAINQASAGLDSAESSYRAAKLSYRSASGESRALQEELAGLQLQQAQINYNNLMDQLNDAVVTAPVAGKVLSVNVQKNNYASPSASSVVLGSTQVMKVTFGLPTNYYSQVQVGDTVVVEAGGQTANAAISEVAPMVNPQTGTFTVTAEFVNGSNFLTGATAKVTLTTQHAEGVLTVPMDCVRYENNQPYVYIEKDGVAAKTFVTLGITDEEVYEVTGGISSADRVIATWHPDLADGAAVAVQ